MKKYFFLLAAVLLVACAHEKTASPASPFEYGPYTVTLISSEPGGDVWHIQDCNSDFPAGTSLDSLGNKRHNNCSDMYLLLGNDMHDGFSPVALLVDLGATVLWCDSAEQSLRHIVNLLKGDRQLTITFTHNHFDHTGMLPAFLGDTSVLYELPVNDFSDSLHFSMFPGEKVNFIGDDEMICLGGMDVRTIEVPGHTPGSMCFSVEGRNILLTGDAIGSGHGVWIFSTEGFLQYAEGVPHLISCVLDPRFGIDTAALRIYGGHYHQKEWLEDGANFPDGQPRIAKEEALGFRYLMDMQQAVSSTLDGTALETPLEIQHPVLNTYFTSGTASVVWNKAQADALRALRK